MSTKKYKLTPEGLTTDRRRGMLLDAIEDREKSPEAFLFTVDELKKIYKAREALIEVADKYRDIPKDHYTPELNATMLNDYEKAFKRKRVPLKELRKFSEKLKSVFYWSASIDKVKLFGKYGLKPFEIYKITTNTPEHYPEKIITPETCPEFYTAPNTAKQAEALGIPALYLFITKTELQILQLLSTVVEQIQEQKKQEEEEETAAEVSGVLCVINSPEMNAILNIGRNARKEPRKTRRFDERGQQITIFEYPTISGVLSLENYNPLQGQGLVSVGDPNTDKLLLQAQSEVVKTGSKEITISMSDFMSFRGLNDKKTASEKARAACQTLMCCSVRIDENTPNASIYDEFHYVQRCKVKTQKGRAGNVINIVFSDAIYNHLITMSTQGRQIEQIDPAIMRIPDNQGTAYNIARKFNSHLRINAEKETARRLSVKKLLSYCPRLPLYPEEPEQFGTDNYIRFKAEAATRIIKPFTDALKYLVDTGIFSGYKFTREGGRSISKEELKRLESDYEFFITLNVEASINNEPDYTNLIEKKNNHIEKAKKAKNNPKKNN